MNFYFCVCFFLLFEALGKLCIFVIIFINVLYIYFCLLRLSMKENVFKDCDKTISVVTF